MADTVSELAREIITRLCRGEIDEAVQRTADDIGQELSEHSSGAGAPLVH